MRQNIIAYTDSSVGYPGFVSINRTESGDVSVTVRSAPVDGREGSQAEFTMPAAEWEKVKAS